MIGNVRGKATEVDRDAVAEAVIQSAMRYPNFRLADRHAIEIDLRELPGEGQGGDDYYRTARSKIDEVFEYNIRRGLQTEDIPHISVFALARLPLLVYLGTKLDDPTPVDIYQRHRPTQSWVWPGQGGTLDISVDVPPTDAAPTEAVLIINVSGTIQSNEIPEHLTSLPLLTLTVVGDRTTDTIASQAKLGDFEAACRRMLGRIESDGYKSVDKLHVLCVMGVSAAVTFGRVFDPDVHPSLVMYDRQDSGSYEVVMQIGKR